MRDALNILRGLALAPVGLTMMALLLVLGDDRTCTYCGKRGHRASHCPWRH